jgi:hypothetical protein
MGKGKEKNSKSWNLPHLRQGRAYWILTAHKKCPGHLNYPAIKNFRLENEATSYLGSKNYCPLLACFQLLPTFVPPIATTANKPQARVAQLVERDLAKVEVASSNLVSRSKQKRRCLLATSFLF